ncbi:MAG: hypothetical protein WKF30_02360 [Pyrinomonadaceae bacterium]
MTGTQSKAWDRWPREPPKAWAAFVAYRDQAETRSFAKTRESLGKRSGYERVIEAWSSRWRWVQRAAAWDAEQDRIKRAAHEQATVEMGYRQAKAGLLLQNRGLTKLVNAPPDAMSVRDALMCIVEGSKLERLARGEATERTITETGKDVSERMYEAAKAGNAKLKRELPDISKERRLAMIKATFGVDLTDEDPIVDRSASPLAPETITTPSRPVAVSGELIHADAEPEKAPPAAEAAISEPLVKAEPDPIRTKSFSQPMNLADGKWARFPTRRR